MNCSDWEGQIALHAGEDLPPAEAAEVERHLRECAGCRAVASGLRQSLGWLREAHAAPLAPAHFTAVRARVVAELERGAPWARRRGALWARRRGWGYGLAAVAVALLAMLALRTGRPAIALRTNRSLTIAALPPPVAALRGETGGGREPVAAPPHRRVARRVVRANEPDTQNGEPLIVKLQTDDPNVVIYWIADRKRGERP